MIADATVTVSNTDLFVTRKVSLGPVGVVGLVTVIGLHIWETVDIWVTGSELHKKYTESHHKASLSILPTVVVKGMSAPGLTVALTF